MSKARIRKKLSGEQSPTMDRYDRMYDKRSARDLFYLIGTFRGPQAPVKYSRCKWCAGAPHHAPDFIWQNYDAFNRRMIK